MTDEPFSFTPSSTGTGILLRQPSPALSPRPRAVLYCVIRSIFRYSLAAYRWILEKKDLKGFALYMFSCCTEEEKQKDSALATVTSMSDTNDKSRALESDSSFSHSKLLRESKEDVYKKYEVLAVLGEGSMGAVSKGEYV
jgi:hypothetical protein